MWQSLHRFAFHPTNSYLIIMLFVVLNLTVRLSHEWSNEDYFGIICALIFVVVLSLFSELWKILEVIFDCRGIFIYFKVKIEWFLCENCDEKLKKFPQQKMPQLKWRQIAAFILALEIIMQILSTTCNSFSFNSTAHTKSSWNSLITLLHVQIHQTHTKKNLCGEIKRGWKRSAFSCWNKSDVVVGIIVNHCRNFKQNFFVMNIFDQYFAVFCYIFKTLQKRRFFHLKIALNTAKSHQKLNFSFFGIVVARKIRSSRHRLTWLNFYVFFFRQIAKLISRRINREMFVVLWVTECVQMSLTSDISIWFLTSGNSIRMLEHNPSILPHANLIPTKMTQIFHLRVSLLIHVTHRKQMKRNFVNFKVD